MINIADNGIITMTAGDTFICPLFINAGNIASPLRYVLTDKDKIYLSIKEPGQPFEHAIVRKIFTEKDLNLYGDVMIRLENSDTENLLPGTYYYEIKFSHENTDKQIDKCLSTIVTDRKFYIL